MCAILCQTSRAYFANLPSEVVDPVISIEGVSIPRLVFVDDLLEMARTFMDTNVGTVSNEIFEKKNRLDFKPSKCKIICIYNCKHR